MTSLFARIALRYLAGALIAKGFLDHETGQSIIADPDIQMAIGAGIAAVTEGWYYLARKWGWVR